MDQSRIATAVSELARNALEHAGGGVLTLMNINAPGKQGLEITVEDRVPASKI